MINATPVILCGGSGTRLWPLSRAGFPKQFLVLSGITSLFQQAIERVNQVGTSDIAVGSTLVVTNEEHRFLSLDQLRELPLVNATGVQYSVRQFIQWSAEELGVTLKFEGKGVDEAATVSAIKGNKAPGLKVGDVVVKIDPHYFRPTEVETLLGDPAAFMSADESELSCALACAPAASSASTHAAAPSSAPRMSGVAPARSNVSVLAPCRSSSRAPAARPCPHLPLAPR